MKSLNKQILKLAIPSILANITIPLVGMVDTAIVGHISSSAAIGGIAVGTMLFDLLYWNFGFLRVGTSGMTAQACGRGHGMGEILVQSLGLAGLGALFIWLIQWLFVTAALACVQASPEVECFARNYFFVRIWAAPATLSLMALKGWFIGMQDTVSPMATDILVNVVNMVASFYLAVCTPLGAIGVAYGTLIAQYSGLILAVTILCAKYKSVLCETNIRATLSNLTGMRRLLVLNANLFVRSLCFMVVYVGYTSLAATYGNDELAASSIMMKLFMLYSFFVDGFAYAGEALVGKTVGQEESGELARVNRALLLHSMAVAVFFMIIYALWGMWMVGCMTSDESVQSVAAAYAGWLIVMPIFSTLAFMLDGIFTGLTDGRAIRNAMIWAAGAFVLSYLLCQPWMGIQALYLAYFSHLAARSIYLGFRLRGV